MTNSFFKEKKKTEKWKGNDRVSVRVCVSDVLLYRPLSMNIVCPLHAHLLKAHVSVSVGHSFIDHKRSMVGVVLLLRRKMVILRDPLARLLSGYISKCEQVG